MKKLLLILLCLPMIGFGQLTMIPDPNFEQALINLGLDNGAINGSVYTAVIDTVTSLEVNNQNISDLTGIEDFTALTNLMCWGNQLTSLDVSQNTALTNLMCWWNQFTSLDVSQNTALTALGCAHNQLTTLDVSQNTALTGLWCGYNQLTTLDVNNNTALTTLKCWDNQITSLDVSNHTALIEFYCQRNQLTTLDVNGALIEFYCQRNQLTTLDISNNTALGILNCKQNQLTTLDISNNTALGILNCEQNKLTSLDVSNNLALTYLNCSNNQFTSLDVRNGNNTNFFVFKVTQNQNLTCIDVDDTIWANNNWTVANWNIDAQHYFSNNCSGTAIEEHTTNKELLRTIDILGRETKGTKNEPLFYIYDDGTVEKRITVE